MLDRNKFIVKAQTKMLSSKKTYDVLDGDSGEALATTGQKKGLLGSVFGMFFGGSGGKIDVRQKSNNAVLFTVRQKGLIFKKTQVVDGKGQVLGSYKAKRLSMSGGFHVYDKDGKHFADIQGKMFKSDYKFMTPDGKREIGSVSKSWGGMAKSLLSGGNSYGVQIAPEYSEDAKAKILVLGATIAIDAIFRGKSSSKESGDSGDE